MTGSIISRLNWVVAASGAVLISANAYAEVQQVTGTPATQTVPLNAAVQVQAEYTVDGSSALTGLGLRTHWDSTKLNFVNVNGLETLGFITTNTVCQADTSDYDNDPATDCFVGTAWARAEGDWPGDPLPKSLLTMNFTSNLGDGDSTSVNFSSSSTAAGYTFAGTSADVNGPTNMLCGDADGNGQVTIVDALAVARNVAGLPPPPPVDTTAADVNEDGSVTIVDALFIARQVAGLDVPGTCFAP